MVQALKWLFCLGFAAAVATGILYYTDWPGSFAYIQKQLDQELKDNLGPDDRWARIKLDGQKAIVTGVAPSQEAKEATLTKIATLPGGIGSFGGAITVIDDKTTVLKSGDADPVTPPVRVATPGSIPPGSIPVESPYRFRADYQGGYIRIAEALPDEETQSRITNHLKTHFPDRQVYNNTRLAAGMPDTLWISMIEQSLTTLSMLEVGVLYIEDFTVKITGNLLDGIDGDQIREKAFAIDPAYTVHIDLGPADRQVKDIREGDPSLRGIDDGEVDQIVPAPLDNNPEEASLTGEPEQVPTKQANLRTGDLSSETERNTAPLIQQDVDSVVAPVASSPVTARVTPPRIPQASTGEKVMRTTRSRNNIATEENTGLATIRVPAPADVIPAPELNTLPPAPEIIDPESSTLRDTANPAQIIIPSPKPMRKAQLDAEPKIAAETELAGESQAQGEVRRLQAAIPAAPSLSPEQDRAYRNCANEVAILTETQPIQFAEKSLAILPKSRPHLAALADVMRRCKDYEFVITGYAKQQDDTNSNQDMAHERAQWVKSYLISRFVNMTKMTSHGVEADTQTIDSRVEIAILRPTGN